MKLWLTLYLTEWKENRNMFFFILLINVGLISVGAYYYEPNDMLKMTTGLIPFFFALLICVIAPPFILSRSFADERRSNTTYLRFSLPVSLWVSSLCKYVAIASMGGVLYGVVFASIYLTDPRVISMGEFRVSLLPLFVGYLFFWLSIAFVMAALKVSLKRFQGLTSGLFFIASIILYFKIKSEMALALTGQSSATDGVFPAIYGLVLLGVGLWLFEKRAEVS